MNPIRQHFARPTLECLESRDLLSATAPLPAHPGNAEAAVLLGLDQLRADPATRALDGRGQAVVLIDSGIDLNHPFFGPDADRNGVADRVVYQWDYGNNDADASDRSGHGSHVGSLIASQDGELPGVAPGVNLIVLKIFADNGDGAFADIEKALQWVSAHAEEYNVAAVNLSLGDGQNWTTAAPQYGLGDELAALAKQNVLVVAASGNAFARYATAPGVSYPSSDPNAIAVGATWAADFGGPFTNEGARDTTTDIDRVAAFSQRSPTMTAVLAPGALLAGATTTGGVTERLGTSQAAALVTGAAVLAQQRAEEHLGRRLSRAEFVRLLQASGQKVIDGDDEQDNVRNTGAAYRRLDVKNLIDLIDALPANWNDSRPLPAIDFAARVVRNDGLSVDEGAATAITGQHLLALDADDPASGVVYRVTRPPAHGRLTLAGAALGVGGTFTQADLNTGRVRYAHDGSETTADSFTVSLVGGSEQATVAITVKPVANGGAPVLDGRHAPAIAVGPAGSSVAELLGSSLTTAGSNQEGIAVVGLGNAMDGTWQYSRDGGKTWQNFGAVYRSRGRLLAATDRVRFLPKSYFHGPAKMTYNGWDMTKGTAGGTVNLLSPSAVGGLTAFSAATQTATWSL